MDNEVANRLEKDVARLRRQLTLTSVLALVLAGALFFETYLQPPTLLEATGFIVVDQSGAPRASLAMLDGSPQLDLMSDEGIVMVSARAEASGGSYLVFDAEGRNRAGIVVTENGPIIGLRGEDGNVTESLPAYGEPRYAR